MKIIIDDKIPFIKGRLEPVAEVVYADPSAFTPEMVKDADALIIRTRTLCDRNLLKGSSVKLIATATIGTDHIDLQWCEDNGIKVVNAAGCNAPGVAQYVWSSLLRNGFDPKIHTLGVVGKGNIGTIVTDWGRLLGAKILVSDPPRKEKGYSDEDYISLEELLKNSDAVTLHTPLTRDGDYPTYHLISAGELQRMKPGAFLINAARGPVADNEALAEWVRAKRGRAVIDVWENEPDINRKLLDEALVATPHIAGYSREGKERATRMVLESIEKFFGVKVDKGGLEGEYKAPGGKIDTAEIIESYDPDADTEALREHPEDFEKLRGDYDYRDEPEF